MFYNYPERRRLPDANFYKADNYGRWRARQFEPEKYDKLSQLQSRKNQWDIKSGCHFSCMEKSKGIQIVASRMDIRTSIQLCTPNTIVCSFCCISNNLNTIWKYRMSFDVHFPFQACDKVLTTYEYATRLCKRYQQKVRGLSGVGMQIAPSVEDPDRSCRIACQDNFIRHRFYLVNGEQGHFPFGARCNHDEPNRYCVNGKCLVRIDRHYALLLLRKYN